MKKTFVTLLLFCLCAQSYAQTPAVSNIGTYYWKYSTIIYSCNKDGTDYIPPAAITNIDFSVAKQFFEVLYEFTPIVAGVATEPYAVIRIGRYNKVKQLTQFLKYNFSGDTSKIKLATSGNYERFFKIKTKDLLICASKYTYIGGAMTGGIINFPFKLRLQKNASDFSSAFNLGAAIGYTLPHKDFQPFTFSLLAAIGFTTINLDASSVTRNADQLVTTNNFTAFSGALGIMTTYDKFQAGIFYGFDRLGKLNNDTFNWNYQNKPWISIGFGYAIFSVQKEKSVNGSTANN